MIETLANSPLVQEYSRAYNETTGMPIAIRPLETWKLPLQGKRKENPWCAMMAEKSGTCAACLQMQDKIAKSTTTQPCTMTCAYGLCETLIPIKLGAETVGYVQTGQVMRQKPTATSFRRALERAEDLGVTLEKEKAREAYFNTPVIPQKKMDSISSLLGIFADHLSIKSNQIAMQAANAEPPMITKAKQFIEENYGKDFGLAEVAQAVHTSKFNFCKLFAKATGIHFTNYVSRVRVEKAKNLLLNPNLRISEIAYEVGFQSLTHFNRIFKKILGESPTEYRANLPTA